jgi:uncharacterized protein
MTLREKRGRGGVAPGRAIVALAMIALAASGCRRDPRAMPPPPAAGGSGGTARGDVAEGGAQESGAEKAVAPKSAAPESATVGAPAQTPAVIIQADGRTILFHVQVARTPEEHANGLVGRPTLASDAGLLFVFASPEVRGLRTENTLMPTDLIFIGADRRIAGIINEARPGSSLLRGIAARWQYVLQIRGGLSSRHGLRAGQPVELRAIPAT